MEEYKGKQVTFKPITYTVLSSEKIQNLKNYWNTVENGLTFCDKKIKNNLKNKIDSIVSILEECIKEESQYKSKRITDEIKEKLDVELNKFNDFIKNIDPNIKGFDKIKNVIDSFNEIYCDVVGITTKTKQNTESQENNVENNSIELFKLFNEKISNKEEIKEKQNNENKTNEQTQLNPVEISVITEKDVKTEQPNLTEIPVATTNEIQDNDNTLNSTQNITIDKVFITTINTATNKEMIDIDVENYYKYLKQNNFSEKSMRDIVLHDNFRKYLFDNAECTFLNEKGEYIKGKNNAIIKNNLKFLYHFVFKPIFEKYKKEISLNGNNIDFINNFFKTLENALKAMKNDKNISNEIGKDILDELIKFTQNSEQEELSKQSESININPTQETSQNFYQTVINKNLYNKKIIKILDNDINRYSDVGKLTSINEIIETLTTEIRNLKLNKENQKKLQKTIILRALVEIYKNNIDEYKSLKSVYNKHNEYFKDKIKIEQNKEDNSYYIKDFSKIIDDFNKEKLKTENGINVNIFDPSFY